MSNCFYIENNKQLKTSNNKKVVNFYFYSMKYINPAIIIIEKKKCTLPHFVENS